MAISRKGKRKITFQNKLYFWFIMKDYDHYYVKIISDDKKLYLSYRINQISDSIIKPKISILKSERFENGVYRFFPPIEDEVISSHNVRAILNWYTNLDETAKPNPFDRSKSPFEHIDFGNGVINHIEHDFSRNNLKEEVLQVAYSNYILVVGWYGSEQGFRVAVLNDNSREEPVFETYQGLYDVREATESAIQFITNDIKPCS